MPISPRTDIDTSGGGELEQASRRLARSRHTHYENPAGALAAAIHAQELARSLGDSALLARAFAMQAAVSLHRGDLRGALGLAVDAQRHAEQDEDPGASAEVAAVKALVSFFTGSYAEALRHAEAALRLAEELDDLGLNIFVRRTTCPVFGNAGVADIGERIQRLLELTIEADDRWEEALSRNDLACSYQARGELTRAEAEIERALEVAGGLESASFALGVIHSTRADIRLLLGRPREALSDAKLALDLLTSTGDPNPYIIGVTVRAEVEARMALGRLEDARQFGEDGLSWLGDRVPQTRSLILTTLAAALREAGRIEEAYEALLRAAELERQAFRELAELQVRLERAALETSAAREQAERDWLTGLHNRRYLARELQRMANEQLERPFSLAVIDLDHFKGINDRFGHATGDGVLVRVAALLCEALRTTDVVVRSGGEEFLMLMPLTETRAATACCERIRERVRAEAWYELAPGLTLTTSIGLASTDDPGDLEALLKLADMRLYEAKRMGRDRVVGTAPVK
jgi:diguanylate cyclase (GGDEF)-like protein